jgi:hypothetical protein
MEEYNPKEYGRLEQKVDYLMTCCEKVEKDIDGMKTRNIAILTSVILLLIGVVVNLILNYAK